MSLNDILFVVTYSIFVYMDYTAKKRGSIVVAIYRFHSNKFEIDISISQYEKERETS